MQQESHIYLLKWDVDYFETIVSTIKYNKEPNPLGFIEDEITKGIAKINKSSNKMRKTKKVTLQEAARNQTEVAVKMDNNVLYNAQNRAEAKTINSGDPVIKMMEDIGFSKYSIV